MERDFRVRSRAFNIAQLVGEAVAKGELKLSNGRTIQRMGKIAASKIIGGLDHNTRVSVGEIARNRFLEIMQRND